MIDEASIEWHFIYTYVKNKIGLELSYYKADQIQRKILSFMKIKDLNQTFNLISYLDHSSKHFDSFLDHITINHSQMFSNIEKWRTLEHYLLPQLYKKEKNIACWNPGCNYGAEAYSLAMILEDKFPGNHTIFCTDIDQKILDKAAQGVFNFFDIKSVPHHYRHKFLKESNKKWSVHSSLKKFISFEKKNLFTPLLEMKFDLIICRNILINFTADVQLRLCHQFFNYLNPGGLLFIGALEKIHSNKKFYFESPFPLFYKKPIPEEKEYKEAA